MLVDFSVVVSVIVLALDASDDNVVDGEDVPGVTLDPSWECCPIFYNRMLSL